MSHSEFSETQALSVIADMMEESKRGCEILEELIVSKIPENRNIKSMNRFRSSYFLMKDKFSEVFRKINGERYFEHLRSVVEIVLNFPKPTVRKSEIAMLHDSIEDTDIDFHFLRILVGPEIAIAVQAITKEPWQNYVGEEDILKDVDELSEHTIILAKERRNTEYFSHLFSFETMKQHLQNIALRNNVHISDEEITLLTQETIDVKLADRIHNLSTQWNPDDIATVERKVRETEEYFLNIAQEVNPEAYATLKKLILKLKAKVDQTRGGVCNIITV